MFGSDFASAYFLFVADHPPMKQIGLLERHHSLTVICPSSWNLQKTNTSSTMECNIIKGERWPIPLVMIFTHKTKNLY